MAARPERNRRMAIAVLRGYNFSQVAEAFDVSRVYVRVTVLRDLCRLLGYNQSYRPGCLFPLSIKEIRKKHKYRLLEKLNENKEDNYVK